MLSDNTCANLLLARIGGPIALTAFWHSTGDFVTRLDRYEPLSRHSRPGEDTTTPAAMAGSLRRFMLGNVLSPASSRLLTRWMLDCKTGTDPLRAGLSNTWLVGDKTAGNSRDAVGDIAVAWPEPAWPIVICAYTQGDSAAVPRLRSISGGSSDDNSHKTYLKA